MWPTRSMLLLVIAWLSSLGLAFYAGTLGRSLISATHVTRLTCDMRGGAMQGRTYLFVLDPDNTRAVWADYDVTLDVSHVSDQRIHTDVKMALAGFPEHTHIGFNFNRLTMSVAGALTKEPSPAEQEQCRTAYPQQNWFCDSRDVVSTSEGNCKPISKQF